VWLTAMPLGEACGVCLELVASSECPSETEIAVLPTCDATHAQGDLCEGDGECGTARTANNCAPNHDVYRRCAAPKLFAPPWLPPAPPVRPPVPTNPPASPSPPLVPLPPCAGVACSAGHSCGVCLVAVNRSRCPTESEVAALPDCSSVEPGSLCEADGECGTATTENNCGEAATSPYHDIYLRELCTPSAGTDQSAASAAAIAISVSALVLVIGAALFHARRLTHRGAPRGSKAAGRSRTRQGDKGEVLVVQLGPSAPPVVVG